MGILWISSVIIQVEKNRKKYYNTKLLTVGEGRFKWSLIATLKRKRFFNYKSIEAAESLIPCRSALRREPSDFSSCVRCSIQEFFESPSSAPNSSVIDNRRNFKRSFCNNFNWSSYSSIPA